MLRCWWVVSECVMAWCCFVFKKKTAYEMRISDWSADVCSSDLQLPESIIRPAMFVLAISLSAMLGWQLSATSAMALHIFAAVASFAWGAWMLDRKSVV